VAGAGWASTADVAAIRRPLVVVPEPRPFDEQLVRARALAAAGLALHVDTWPTPTRLADVLAEAGTLDPAAWAEFHDGHGARRAATMIDAVHGSPIAERDP
jgi:predicted glycosyltransferase